MKYTRLTKEQFEELHQEFINFLATQSITADEWTNLKVNSPETAEMELDVFSDLIWEGVLQNANYLENVSPQQLFLFQIAEDKMTLITLRVLKDGVDITNAEGYKWLQENYSTDDVEFYTASKDYSEDKNADIFSLIEQGAIITKGALFSFFSKIINA
ncbi:MAG: hypothetical protein KUG68_07235 [Flavobacteriaceae bacterium]|nr:hypothetical protein [Flavobacteriaceae bacterium]